MSSDPGEGKDPKAVWSANMRSVAGGLGTDLHGTVATQRFCTSPSIEHDYLSWTGLQGSASCARGSGLPVAGVTGPVGLLGLLIDPRRGALAWIIQTGSNKEASGCV